MMMMKKMVSEFLSCIIHHVMDTVLNISPALRQFCNVEHIILSCHLSNFILSMTFFLALSCVIFTLVVGLEYLRFGRSVVLFLLAIVCVRVF